MNQEKLNIELDKLLRRRKFFSNRFPEIAGMKGHRFDHELELPNTCPVCGFYSLGERNSWEICGICYWEDDGQDEYNKEEVKGGPNGKHSLESYRTSFYTAIDKSKISRAKSLIRKFHKLIKNQEQVDKTEISNLIYQV